MLLTPDERSALQRFSNLELPRHTSYPSVPFWRSDGAEANALMTRLLQGEDCGVNPLPAEHRDLAEIYVHIPFCEAQCLYCGCNRQTLPRSETAQRLLVRTLDALLAEIKGLESFGDLRASQIHFGGGTPNYLSGAELGLLVEALRHHLAWAPSARLSIEIDARHLKLTFLSALKDWGFGMASIGVQDLDPNVQRVIGREQSFEQIERAVQGLRAHDVDLINFDLIYGLPGQTRGTWRDTLRQCLDLRPSRFSIFRLALLPERFPWQRGLSRSSSHVFPDSMETADLLMMAKDVLGEHGYVPIGLDHFALPSDPLFLAHQEGRLGRSFQGYVENDRIQTVGLGPSALTFYHGVYAQREKDVASWLRLHDSAASCDEGVREERSTALEGGWVRSYALNARDARRFQAIQAVYGRGIVPSETVADEPEEAALHRTSPVRQLYLAEGILEELPGGGLRLTDRLGRLLCRLIASHLDDYFAGHGKVGAVGRRDPQHSAAF